jgi:arabinose-5-phosphate isomerase
MSQEAGRRVLRQEAAAVLACADLLDEAFALVVDALLECRGRVITCGVGKSGHIARKTAGTLSSTGTPSLFLHAGEAVHGDLGMATADDVVLMYSHSGETDELVRLFPSLKAIGARTILITGRPDSSAGRQASIVLDTHVQDEACSNNLAPTTSTTVMLALSDALAIAVMERRGFTHADFAKFHPSGTLGKRLLLTVGDVMRPAKETAIATSEMPILEVMRAITQSGVGAACVVEGDTLLGIITEGDLRRHIIASGLSAIASEFMTPDPSTIGPDLLAIEALEVFQNLPKSIGELPVIDHGRFVGLLTLKDLLRAGIV